MKIESITVWNQTWDGLFTEDLFVINGLIYAVSGGGSCEHRWNFSRIDEKDEKRILNSKRGKIHHLNDGRMIVSENEEVDEEYKQFILRALQSFQWRQRENLT